MDDDDLPPWLGAAFEDVFHQIFRNQYEAEQEAPAHQETRHVHD